MNNFFKKHRINILIIFIFLILPFIFFRDSFKLNSIILGSGDPTSYYIPLHQLSSDLIKSFDMPFWNRYSFSGSPLLSNPQASIFSPIVIILNLFLPIVLSYNLSILLHISLAGIFIYLFLNEYSLSKFACFTAGVIFMFSGILASHRSHAVIIYTVIWIPLILYFLERFRKTKGFEFVLLASLFYGISFLGGHPQTFFYSSIIILLFIIYYAFIYKGGKNYFFLWSMLVFIIGLLIVSVQFISTYELMKNSVREYVSYDYFTSFSFNIKLLPVLLFPFLYGNPFFHLQNVPAYFGPWNYTEMVIYFGISTIPFLILGFFSKNKHKYLWIFILIFSFLLVLGNQTPLYKLLYYIPIFNKFRVPARHWFEFGLAFSILSGFGFDYLVKANIKKIKKTIIGIVVVLVIIFTGFFIFYLLLSTNLKDNIASFITNSVDKAELFLHSVRITNYSIFIPLIILLCNIIIFSILMLKKNKFFYISLILLICFDVFYFGYFYEGNSDIDYLSNKIENSDNLEFLKGESDLFRICPIAPGISGIILNNNKNIHNKIDSIIGNDTLMLRNYNFITEINESSDANTNWTKLLKNNNILSMLNTKYIILPIPDDIDSFEDDLTRSYWKNEVEPILDNNIYEKAEFNGSRLSDNKGEIIIGGDKSTIKLYKVPINIESNKDYIISFEIRENRKIDNYIYFDFYGDNYDNPNQEFYLGPDDIEGKYIRIERIINSEDIPTDVGVYFRIFTSSVGEYSIKDLEVHEVIRYYDYKIIYDDGTSIVLENKNFIPRFYFVSEVRNVNNLEEVKNILWEKDIFWDYDKFDIKTIALVEDVDFSRRKFNTQNVDLDIINYKNNEVILEITSEDDSFLIFSDTYYPGWRAYIDNNEARVYRTNGVIKGIYVPKGKHDIIFRYIPNYFWISIIISLSTFILIVVGIVILFLRRLKLNK